MRSIVVNEQVTIPESAIEMRAIRSGGPGGQNVNKVASKIQMWIDLSQATGFESAELEQVRFALRSRLDAQGRLMVSSQATRDRERNVEDCLVRAAEWVRAALRRPKTRIRTKPTRASKERRQEQKRRRSQRLVERRVPWER